MIAAAHVTSRSSEVLEVACNGDLDQLDVARQADHRHGRAKGSSGGARRVVGMQSHASKDGNSKHWSRPWTLQPNACAWAESRALITERGVPST